MVPKTLTGFMFTLILAALAFLIIKWLAKKNVPKSMRLRFCPKCGSQKIDLVQKNFAIFFPAPLKYKCRECGFEGPTLPEAKNEKELIMIRKKLKKKI